MRVLLSAGRSTESPARNFETWGKNHRTNSACLARFSATIGIEPSTPTLRVGGCVMIRWIALPCVRSIRPGSATKFSYFDVTDSPALGSRPEREARINVGRECFRPISKLNFGCPAPRTLTCPRYPTPSHQRRVRIILWRRRFARKNIKFDANY